MDKINKYEPCTMVAKGQVWMVNESSKMTNLKIELRSNLIAKTRPYLILAPEDEFGIITAIPITTSLAYVGKHEIVFVGGDRGKVELLKMTQIVSIEKRNLYRYLYAMSDSIMRDVEKCIIERLSLRPVENKPVLNTNTTNVIPAHNKSVADIEVVRKPHERWKPDTMEMYVSDYKNMTKEQISVKYSVDPKHINERYKYIMNRLNH